MEVILAKTAGFCFGVARAVELARGLIASGKPSAALGEPIHNPAFTKELLEGGMRLIASPDEARKGETVLIRSHGEGPDTYAALAAAGAQTADATCPFVKRIHELAASLGEGDLLLLAGDETHPEIKGIIKYAKSAVFVFKNADFFKKTLYESRITEYNNIILAAQTTFSVAEWEKCAALAAELLPQARVEKTICGATAARQKEAAELAAKCDAMIVVGGRNSSNTAKLYELCRKHCDNTVLIESASELDMSRYEYTDIVGITAGASTPSGIIEEVVHKMNEETKDAIIESQEPEAIAEETKAAEAVETEVKEEEPVKEVDLDEMSFAEAVDYTFKTLYTGERVTGRVIGITPTEVQIELNTKHYAFIPLAELSSDTTKSPEELVSIGDELDLIVTRVNDVDGMVTLSKKRVDAMRGYEEIEKAVGTQVPLEGTVTDAVNGGVIAIVNGVRVFIPASRTGIPRDGDLSVLVGTTQKIVILEINPRRRRVIGSIKAGERRTRKELAAQLWSEIEVGKKYTGKVKSLTSYGAFVDIGGVDGMVHVSEMSWERGKKPEDIFKIGDRVEVYVKDFDQEKKRISLGYRKEEDNPWNTFTENFAIGDVIDVTVNRLMSFGAFVAIVPGIDGLIHISQIADRRIEKASDELKVGQQVKAKITSIDPENHKVGLSIRALLPKKTEEAPADEAAAEATEAVAEAAEDPAAIEVPAEVAPAAEAVEEAAAVVEEAAAPVEEAAAAAEETAEAVEEAASAVEEMVEEVAEAVEEKTEAAE